MAIQAGCQQHLCSTGTRSLPSSLTPAKQMKTRNLPFQVKGVRRSLGVICYLRKAQQLLVTIACPLAPLRFPARPPGQPFSPGRKKGTELLSLVSLLCVRNCCGSFARGTSLNPLSHPVGWVSRRWVSARHKPWLSRYMPCPGPHGSEVVVGESRPWPLHQSL